MPLKVEMALRAYGQETEIMAPVLCEDSCFQVLSAYWKLSLPKVVHYKHWEREPSVSHHS